MNARSCPPPVSRRPITLLLAAGACSLVAVQPAVSGEGHPGSPEETQEASAAAVAQPVQKVTGEVAAGASGMLIHIDPSTGRIVKQPAPGTVPLQLTPQELNALSTTGKGLVEVPSAVPGGGVRIDLQGRFQSPVFATVGPDGKLVIRHLQEIPATGSDESRQDTK
jgi:hypothetical protein